jgi:dihydrofolate reductase
MHGPAGHGGIVFETIVKKGGTSYVFVTEGIDAAMAQAQAAAGAHGVMVNGGADIARQCLNAGLIDESRLHAHPSCSAAALRCLPAYALTCGWSRARRPTAHLPRT